MKNIDINEKTLRNNPKRYLLIKEDSYGKEVIRLNVDDKDINKDGQMTLSTIYSVTSKYANKNQLLYDYGLYDSYDKESSGDVYIEYKTEGAIRKLPVMYNDELLAKIANNSKTKLWNSNQIKHLITDMSFEWLKNDNRFLEKLLHGKFKITNQRFRNVIGYAINHGTHTMNIGSIKKDLLDGRIRLKDFYALYYNSDQGYKRKK